ncbi:hypothetical protein AYO38_06530 [bacterium SCGC AG-212-C10]|nr:hypothetical protein AYO38_06530 [bacterium SCGC AG-212-C10]
MYLKRLSVQGFKSFANRIVFEFGPGVTAVVGPNGSGKSNVSDAIRWVLGEQSVRLLRAKKQEDVIFSGARDRSAVGMAEVLLTLDNEDRWLPVEFAEVEIGRRLYRNGDTEYLLNGSRVRMRDIVDLLLKGDVGQNSYTIMGQGLVDEVLSMNADERRTFLDEAADVKRFRLKIKEAQDRLGATRQNLERVELVISEIEPRLAQLSRQAERAIEHTKLSAELGDLLRLYYGQRWSDAQNSLVRSRAALDQSLAEDAAANTRVEQLRDQQRALTDEIRRRKDAIARRDTRNAELDARYASVEQAIALDRERIGMLATRREEIRVEIEALEAERATLGQGGADDGRRSEEVTAEVNRLRAEMQTYRETLDLAERDYASIRSKLQETKDGAEADDRRARGAEGEAIGAERRLDELDRDWEQTLGKRRTIIGELQAYGRRFAQVHDERLEALSRIDSARGSSEHARERLRRVQDEVRQYEEGGKVDLRELDHLEGRLDALRRVHAEHDGIAAGTRNVLIMGQALIEGIEPGSLGEPPDIAGVVGLLARQLRVPAGLEVAINAALEQRLHAVVVENEEAALKAISLLQTRKQGRAQFLPLDTVRHVYPLNMQKEKGVIGIAAKLVRCDAKFRPLIDTLLGRIIVCEDVATGLRMIRRSLGSVVTLDGTYVEPTGVMSGGATGAEEGAFTRQRELDELPVRIAELRERTELSAQQLERGFQTIEQLIQSANAAEAAYEQLRRASDQARTAMEREREKLHRLRRDMDSVRNRQRQIGQDYRSRQAIIEQAQQAADQFIARRDERRAALPALEDELRVAVERREAALKAVSEAGSRIAAVEGERKTLIAMREQQVKSAERLAAQANARRLQAKNLELEVAVIEERLAKLDVQLDEVRAAQARFAEDGAPDHDELTRFEARERQVQDELNQAQEALFVTQRRRLDLDAEVARASDLISTLRSEMEREGMGPDRQGRVVGIDEATSMESLFERDQERAIQGGAILDMEESRQRIEELRSKIRRLGTINEEAPEDYRETRERYDYLTTQMADLSEAQGQLRLAIGELNEEVRHRFGVTFEQVNTAFGEYFKAFFGGGEATLLLTDPANLAESGIEIEAQPPGKKIKSLSLLSGGERSLTAVALLFALLSANPAPFCVLDEVDAALDEANVGRFTNALKTLSEKTQFLVVTHNRRTVEVGDAIYGVSMNQDGISRVLSLKLSDVPKD